MRIAPFADAMTFEQFCDRHGIKLVAHERSKRSGLPRWYVSPQGPVEIRGGGVLTSKHGSGDTPEEALANYARQLAGETLLIGGGHEVTAPNEWSS